MYSTILSFSRSLTIRSRFQIPRTIYAMRTNSVVKMSSHEIGRNLNNNSSYKGPSIKYDTLFWTNFDPPPSPVTLCHLSRDPPKVGHTSRTPPRFLVVHA